MGRERRSSKDPSYSMAFVGHSLQRTKLLKPGAASARWRLLPVKGRSSLAMTSLALCFLQAGSAFANSRRELRFPLSIAWLPSAARSRSEAIRAAGGRRHGGNASPSIHGRSREVVGDPAGMGTH
jgi:hypothetical protein